MGEIRNLLKSQSLGNTAPTALNFSGKNVFPDETTIPDQRDLVEIVASWRAVATPTYGQTIPQTAEEVLGAVTDNDQAFDVLTPTGNIVYEILGCHVENNGGSGTVAGNVYYGTTLIGKYSAGAGEKNLVTIPNPLFVTGPFSLAIENTSGTAADVGVQFVYNSIAK